MGGKKDYGVKKMVESVCADGINIPEGLAFSELMEAVLENLSQDRLLEMAEKMQLQIPGFRLKKAPKFKLFPEIAKRAVLPPGIILTYEMIRKEYPNLVSALEDENTPDIAYWQKTCGQAILIFALLATKKDYTEQIERLLAEGNIRGKTYKKKSTREIESAKDQTNMETSELERLKEENKKLKKFSADKDRKLGQKDKELKKLEAKLKEERSQYGKESTELGFLRKENSELKKDNLKLKDNLTASRLERMQLRQQHLESKEHLNELKTALGKNKQLALFYGKDLEKLVSEKRLLQLEGLKWEARWQVGNFLKEQNKKQRTLKKSISLNTLDLQKAYLELVKKQAAKLLEDFLIADLNHKKAIIKELESILAIEETVAIMPLATEEICLEGELFLEPFEYSHCFSLQGIFSYEGLHGWVRTKEGSFLITPELILNYNLVTGDKLNITLYHEFEDDNDIGINIEILQKVESVEQVCTLQKKREEIFVINGLGYPIQLSQAEFENIGCNTADPVTVVFPDLNLINLPDMDTVFGRVIKSHDPTWIEMLPKERKRSEKKRAMANCKKEPLEPILAGENILVVGGETFKEQLREIVEKMAGNFIFQPGFSGKPMVEGQVRKATKIVIVTTEVSHVIKELTLKAAEKYKVEYRYYNERGAVLFGELLRGFAN